MNEDLLVAIIEGMEQGERLWYEPPAVLGPSRWVLVPAFDSAKWFGYSASWLTYVWDLRTHDFIAVKSAHLYESPADVPAPRVVDKSAGVAGVE